MFVDGQGSEEADCQNGRGEILLAKSATSEATNM